MLNKMRSKQGFTLIELLIVVAIIGILAAIAIPQLSAYRMRGYNSAALSDMKNISNAEESLNTTSGVYGRTVAAAMLPAPGSAGVAGGLGASVTGPQPAALTALVGLYLAGTDANNTFAGLGFGLSSNINCIVNSDNLPSPPASAAGMSSVFSVFAKHVQGDTAYAAQQVSTSVFQNAAPANVGVALTALPTGVGPVTTIPAANTAVIAAATPGWALKP